NHNFLIVRSISTPIPIGKKISERSSEKPLLLRSIPSVNTWHYPCDEFGQSRCKDLSRDKIDDSSGRNHG
ncbi:MAG: hypothetical protein ACXWXZ_12535, partial [Candidatus Binatia bacterium]